PAAAHGEGPDRHGYAWAEKYVEFAAGPMREWLHRLGVRWFPLVQWAERGGYLAGGHGNTVPRFHVTWGPARGSSRRSSLRRTGREQRAGSDSSSGTGSASSSPPMARSPASAPMCSPTMTPPGAPRAAGR